MPTTSVRRLISLFNRSIAWSQYTFSARDATQRDDVADLHVLAVDHDAVDQELDQCAALVEVRVFETGTDRIAEVFDACGYGLQVVALHGFSSEHLLVTCDLCQSRFELCAALLEFVECECFRLVRIH